MREDVVEPETLMESALDPRFQIVAKAPSDVPCVHCGTTGGVMFKIRGTHQGPHGNVDVLHEGCAQAWFGGAADPLEIPDYLKRA